MRSESDLGVWVMRDSYDRQKEQRKYRHAQAREADTQTQQRSDWLERMVEAYTLPCKALKRTERSTSSYTPLGAHSFFKFNRIGVPGTGLPRRVLISSPMLNIAVPEAFSTHGSDTMNSVIPSQCRQIKPTVSFTICDWFGTVRLLDAINHIIH